MKRSGVRIFLSAPNQRCKIMSDYLTIIEKECSELSYTVTRETHRLLVKSDNSVHTVDVSWSRDAFVCVDNDNEGSEYYTKYTKHIKLHCIMEAIKNKLNEK